MKALETTLQLLSSAGMTSGMFALPLGLCLLGNAGIELAEIHPVVSAAERVVQMQLPALDPELATLADGPSGSEEGGASDLTGGDGPHLGNRPKALAGTGALKARAGFTKVSRPGSESTATPAKRSKDCLPENPSIARDGSRAWEVDRGLVSDYAKHPGRLDDLGWSARHKDAEGKADGFKIGGIQCGNDLHQAGLRSGDVVHSINGRSVNNLTQAIAAYWSLRKSETVEVEISRKGTRRTLTYTLVG